MTSDGHTESRRHRTKKPRLPIKTKVRPKAAKHLKRKSQDVENPISENLVDLEGLTIDDADSDDDSDSGCILDDAEEENRENPPGVSVIWEEIVVPDERETGEIHDITVIFA